MRPKGGPPYPGLPRRCPNWAFNVQCTASPTPRPARAPTYFGGMQAARRTGGTAGGRQAHTASDGPWGGQWEGCVTGTAEMPKRINLAPGGSIARHPDSMACSRQEGRGARAVHPNPIAVRQSRLIEDRPARAASLSASRSSGRRGVYSPRSILLLPLPVPLPSTLPWLSLCGARSTAPLFICPAPLWIVRTGPTSAPWRRRFLSLLRPTPRP